MARTNSEAFYPFMDREPNTDVLGQSFDEKTVEAVWLKAQPIGDFPALRMDGWGWTMVRQDYGNTQSRYGWEIDHIIPVFQGGTDDLSNLQPLHWENNRRKDELHAAASAHYSTQKRTAPASHHRHPRRKGH